jgi:hypothetical protein
MTTKPPLQKILQGIVTQKIKANKTMKGQAVPNHRKRKDKESESNIDLSAHYQIHKQQKQQMTRITTHLSILTLNVNGLNSPIKRHHLANWIKMEDPTICCF